MRTSSRALFALVLWAAACVAQVVSPLEIKDPALRALQQRHLDDLRAVAIELNQHHFAYPFYFSRKLDLDEQSQKLADQRSIRFDHFNNQIALEITGNYYASYSDERVDADHRLRQTFSEVMLPILQAVAPRLAADEAIGVFAIEVSHHVRRKLLGVGGEYPENVVVVVPRELALRLVNSQDAAEQQTLMMDAEVYRSGKPTVLWLAGERPLNPDDRTKPEAPTATVASVRPTSVSDTGYRSGNVALPTLPKPAPPPELRAPPVSEAAIAQPAHPHDSSPDALKALQEKFQPALDKLVHEHASDAHFVAYAPPAFITFKHGAYLQLSLTTVLDAHLFDSQYKLAALAFDRHIAHLVRPVLGYFKDTAGIDGIDFSTTVKLAGDKDGSHAIAVEFILPLSALHCLQEYDCTGQQALNSGIILINGERAGLELQSAEAK